MRVLVRSLQPHEIVDPEDGIWIFPNADGHLQRIKDVVPHLAGKPAGVYADRIRRVVKELPPAHTTEGEAIAAAYESGTLNTGTSYKPKCPHCGQEMPLWTLKAFRNALAAIFKRKPRIETWMRLDGTLVECDPDKLIPIPPEKIAAILDDPELRKQIVYPML